MEQLAWVEPEEWTPLFYPCRRTKVRALLSFLSAELWESGGEEVAVG